MSRTLLITGTDTGVGKTVVTATLARGLGRNHRVACFKPVASGCLATAAGLRNEDALKLIDAANVALPYDTVNPIALAPPIAPHLAAARAGVVIDPLAMGTAICAVDADYRLVEGAGGWMVPLGGESMTVDLARACGAEIILVVGIRLGCINHALLTARAIIADNMRLVGWIANHTQADIPDADDIIDAISLALGAPLVTCRFQPSPADAHELADSISSRQ